MTWLKPQKSWCLGLSFQAPNFLLFPGSWALTRRSYVKGPVSTHKNFHYGTFRKWVQGKRVPDPSISIFVLVKTQVCPISLPSKDLPGRDHCTVWVTNGMANSPCNSPCTLMMSWLEGSHRPFQTLTYLLPPPNTSKGSEKVSVPFVLQMRKLRPKTSMRLPRSPLRQMCSPVHCSSTDPPGTRRGNLSRRSSILTRNCHRVSSSLLSVHLEQCLKQTKQGYSAFWLLWDCEAESAERTDTHLSAICTTYHMERARCGSICFKSEMM